MQRRRFRFESLEARRLLAQIAVGVADDTDVVVGDTIEIATNHSTDPVEQTAGLNLRLYFNDSLVDFAIEDLTLPEGVTPQGTPEI